MLYVHDPKALQHVIVKVGVPSNLQRTASDITPGATYLRRIGHVHRVRLSSLSTEKGARCLYAVPTILTSGQAYLLP